MEKNSALHLFYKNLGETPYEAILRFKQDNPEYKDLPMTYAGRLDPMAEGFILLLSGEKLTEKGKYLDLHKTYEFEILWGFETDTLDLLGIVSSGEFLVSSVVPEEKEVQEYLEKSVGKFEQSYPAYSSKPVLGKPLFVWARENRINEIEIPKHEVEVFESKYIERKEITGGELLEQIISKVSLVNGDFRQEEIIKKWKDVLENKTEEKFIIDKLSLKVSSGFYIRQFASDMGKNFGTKALAFSIKRTKVGEFYLGQ